MRGEAWNVSGGRGVYTGEARELSASGANERGKFGRAADDKLILLPRIRRGMILIGTPSAFSVASKGIACSNLQIFFFFFFFLRSIRITSGFLRELNSTV